jgi:hypothetical protein
LTPMRRAPRWSRIGAVDRRKVVIRLELCLANDSLTGRASVGSGAAREFVGWMGLVSAVDALIPGSSRDPAAPDSIGTGDGEVDR